jgi:hypothetical protein
MIVLHGPFFGAFCGHCHSKEISIVRSRSERSQFFGAEPSCRCSRGSLAVPPAGTSRFLAFSEKKTEVSSPSVACRAFG